MAGPRTLCLPVPTMGSGRDAEANLLRLGPLWFQ